MKKLIYIATMALGVLATSCADDFLTTEPNSTIDSEIVNEIMAADVEQLQAYISAGYDEHYWAYQKATNSDELGAMSEIFFTDLMAGDATSPQRLYGWFVWDMQNDNRLAEYRRPRSLWAPMYYIITNCCNPVIETLANLEEQTETTKSILYQAYALRAYNYFKLINYFQQPYQVNKDALGVPLYTEDATKNIPGRATVAQIYDQIISDLDNAYALAEGKAVVISAQRKGGEQFQCCVQFDAAMRQPVVCHPSWFKEAQRAGMDMVPKQKQEEKAAQEQKASQEKGEKKSAGMKR